MTGTERDREREAAFSALKKKLKRGAAQVERGELVDGEQFLDKMIGKLRKSQKPVRAA